MKAYVWMMKRIMNCAAKARMPMRQPHVPRNCMNDTEYFQSGCASWSRIVPDEPPAALRDAASAASSVQKTTTTFAA